MVHRFLSGFTRISRTVLLVVLVAFTSQMVLGMPPAAAATPGTEAVQGLASYFLTMPYGGIKMAVALLGALAGGMGFIFTGGDKATAGKIWGPTLGGEYVITPEHIRGDKDLHFFGKAPTN
jgi:hypothetical protein